MNIMNCSVNIPEYSITPFSLNEGNAMLLFMYPGYDVKFCEKIKNPSVKVTKYPYWVKFSIEKINKESINIINQNMEYLHPYFSANFPYGQLKDKEIKQLSGWDIRLINMFLMRKQYNVNFFEINISGLSYHSIELMFNFLLKEIEKSYFESTYLIVEPREIITNTNPIIVNMENLEDVIKKYYTT
jgi:hypothetical protein